jgi:ABC-2 type transport system ATP-binding protein
MNVLEIQQLHKTFGGLTVVDNLSLTVPANAIFGFIGRNGAGKTTTMKMILGFLKPTSGQIFVCGEKVAYGNTHTNRHIGYLPDVPEFYGYMTPTEYLRLCGQITGLTQAETDKKARTLLELVDLAGNERRIQGFSRGMKQRLGIAQALLNSPKLLICDEPTSALDPIGRKEILDILHRASQQTTVLFSTHILTDVERICDRIGIIEQGKLIVEGDISALKNTYRQNRIRIEPENPEHIPNLIQSVQASPQIQAVETDSQGITVNLIDSTPETNQAVFALIAQAHIPIMQYTVLEPSLENVFLEAVQ